MERVNSFSVAEVLTSADMNSIQDDALGIAQVPYLMVGGLTMRCDDGSNLKISGINGIVLPGFPNDDFAALTENTFQPSSTGALSADTWYYVYAGASGGAISFGKTTTPPGSDLAVVGAADQRYIGCFKTRVSANTILSFRMVRGRYIYQSSDHTAGEFGVNLSGGTSATYALADLSPWLPPHSRLAIVSLGLVADGSNQIANFRTGTDANDSNVFLQHSLAGTDSMWRDLDFIVGSSRDMYYKVSSGGTVLINVAGFSE